MNMALLHRAIIFYDLIVLPSDAVLSYSTCNCVNCVWLRPLLYDAFYALRNFTVVAAYEADLQGVPSRDMYD